MTDSLVYSGVQLSLPDESWAPLALGPFLYRTLAGNKGSPAGLEGSSIQQLEEILRKSGADNVKIHVDTGEFELDFDITSTRPARSLLRFSPCSFIPGYIPWDYTDYIPPKFQYSAGSAVQETWLRMEKEFKNAVLSGHCKLYGRVKSPLSNFTPIPPDVFRNITKIGWTSGGAELPFGERIFSLHVAHPSFVDPLAASEQLQPAEQTPTSQRRKPIAIKQDRVRAAIRALEDQGIKTGKFTNKELALRVAEWLQSGGHEVPGHDTIMRAAGRRK